MGAVTGELAAELKATVRAVLGSSPSAIFLGRVDKVFDDAAADQGALAGACARVVKMVNLFIGVDEAKVLEKRLAEMMR